MPAKAGKTEISWQMLYEDGTFLNTFVRPHVYTMGFIENID